MRLSRGVSILVASLVVASQLLVLAPTTAAASRAPLPSHGVMLDTPNGVPCNLIELDYPFKTSGPAIRSRGMVTCSTYVNMIDLIVEIYVWAGTGWVQVASNQTYVTGHPASAITVATSGRCASTNQYYAQAQYYAVYCTAAGCSQGFSPWYWAGPVNFITC
jgi:hypothetical protein